MARATGRARASRGRNSRAQAGRSRSKSAKRSGRSSSRATASASQSRRVNKTAVRREGQPSGARRRSGRSVSGSRRQSNISTDHNEIRRWAEERGAQPACVRGTGRSGDIGMLRLDFPGYTGAQSLQPISWDDWFRKFDESNLALLYEEKTARGQKSNFNKLIGRETTEKRRRGKVAKSSRRAEPVARTRKKAA